MDPERDEIERGHGHSADGAMLGKGSFKDFQLFAGQVPGLDQGGVVVNLGSAVLLPEVFLKSLTVARNLWLNERERWRRRMEMRSLDASPDEERPDALQVAVCPGDGDS